MEAEQSVALARTQELGSSISIIGHLLIVIFPPDEDDLGSLNFTGCLKSLKNRIPIFPDVKRGTS